jgi:hypothetical protein
VHFHALIRLDAIDPTDPDAILAPPDAITAADLVELVADATATTGFRTPDYADTTHSWPIRWGPQVDIRPLGLAGDQITCEAVAAYLAKYATKATEPTGMPITTRMTAEAAEHFSDPDTHLGRLVAYAFQLGTRPRSWNSEQQKVEWHDTWGRLQRWTHMLGFGGHFATKSRRYSTTHKTLRAARRTWRRTQHHEWRQRHFDADLGDTETTLIIGDLTLAGIGWNTTADAQLAAEAAARARAYRALVKEERTTA